MQLNHKKTKHLPESYGFRNKNCDLFPEMVVVAMCFVCDANCIHCPNAATNFSATLKGPDRFMDEDVLQEISRQCANQPTLLRISSFGEILMHPNSIEMICTLLNNKTDKNVALTTNGSLLTHEKSYKLMQHGIRSIEFSVDAADKETFEKIRKGLSWDIVLGNIERCVEIRNTYNFSTKILVSVIEQPENEDKLKEIEKFWSAKVDKVLTRKLLSFKGIIKRPSKYEEYMPADTPCPFLWERVVIDPLGDVRGCVSDVDGDFVIGNIMTNNLKEIWHSQEIEEYRKKHLAGKRKNCFLCKDCVDVQYRSWNYNYFHALEDAK